MYQKSPLNINVVLIRIYLLFNYSDKIATPQIKDKLFVSKITKWAKRNILVIDFLNFKIIYN